MSLREVASRDKSLAAPKQLLSREKELTRARDPSTSDEVSNGLLDNLHRRDATFAVVFRAPLAKVEQDRAARGWTLWCNSSYQYRTCDVPAWLLHGEGRAGSNSWPT